MLSLMRLRHIVALAEERSFTRAAERLGVTQPSLSRSITELERVCGLRLFDRGSLGIQPTKLGIALVADAQLILGQVERIEQNILHESRGEAGAIAIGLGPLTASYMLEKLLTTCLMNWPLLSISVSIDSSQSLLDQVLNGIIDFCICGVDRSTLPDKISQNSLGSINLSYFVRSDHPLIDIHVPLQWDDLAPFPRAAGTTQPLPYAPAKVFGPLDATVRCDDYNTLRSVTLQTDTIWATSPLLINNDLDSGAIKELTVCAEMQLPSPTMSIVRLSGRSFSPALKQVMATAIDLAKFSR